MKRLSALLMGLALLALSLGPAMPAEAAPVTIVNTTTTQNAAAANGNGTAANLGGLGTAAIIVTGTFSATVTFQASIDGSTYANINCFAAGSTTPVQSTTSTGAWVCPNLAGATTVLTPVSSYVSGSVTVTATGMQVTSVTPIGADPCQSPTVTKTSAAISISSATTTQLVPLASGKAIYVCQYNGTLTGTSPTVQFEYGTGSTCGTGTTVLTGAYAPTAGGEIRAGYGGTVITAPASNALCVLTGGTSPGFAGAVTYVVQ